MQLVKTLAIASIFVLFGAGCASSSDPDGLVKIKTPSGDTIKVTTAVTLDEQAQGLSGTDDIGDGMVFCFPDSKPRNFWMLDMHVPLDIVWIDNGNVAGVSANVPIQTDNDWTRISSEDPADAVLEVPAGTALGLGIVPGVDLADVIQICL